MTTVSGNRIDPLTGAALLLPSKAYSKAISVKAASGLHLLPAGLLTSRIEVGQCGYVQWMGVQRL